MGLNSSAPRCCKITHMSTLYMENTDQKRTELTSTRGYVPGLILNSCETSAYMDTVNRRERPTSLMFQLYQSRHLTKSLFRSCLPHPELIAWSQTSKSQT